MKTAGKIRVLVVDDHTLFREGLARLLSGEPDIEVAAHCGTVSEALEAMRSVPLDLVLLDIDLPGERGSQVLRRAGEVGFSGRVLVVTAGIDDRESAEVLSYGAAGIFPKSQPPSLLARSIRSVMSGEVWLEQRFLSAALRAAAPRQAEEPHKTTFTERERQVLHGVLEGLANKQIGARLGISEGSVKAALQQLFDKTGVRTRSQLVRVAIEQYGNQL